MRKNDLVELVKASATELLPKLLEEAKRKQSGRPTYVCPICGHGKGGDGLAINPRHPEQIHCFGCGFNGDIIDLYRQQHGSGYIDTIKTLGWQLGRSLDDFSDEDKRRKSPSGSHKSILSVPNASGGVADHEEDKSPLKPKCEAPEPIADYSDYYAICRQALEDNAEAQSYLARRGIDLDTARRFGLGYDPEADPAGGNHPASRIIIPVSAEYYTARAITSNLYKAIGPRGASPRLFNGRVLSTGGVVYVVEGAFDAMSITIAGGLAVAINSVANIRLVADAIKAIKNSDTEDDKPPRMVIIALDNDEAGARAAKQLSAMLTEINQPYYIADRLSAECKDANELLTKDKQRLVDNVHSLVAISVRPHGVATYILRSLADDIERQGEPKPTGIKTMDEILGGGMRTGLHVLAAMSSIGKTTLALQIAQGLAERGAEVLYISLEQSALELTAKLIARQAYLSDRSTDVTAMSVMDGKAYAPEVDRAVDRLVSSTANRLNIIAAPFGMTTSDICREVDRHRQATGVTPVVIIDYLQAITPDKERPEARLAIDDVVRMLAIKSKEIATPIMVLSSLNRQAYKSKAVGMDGLKESGGIEYTADYLWGLTLDIQGKAETISALDIQAAKSAYPRKMAMTLIKGRCCSVGDSVYLDYYSSHDHYEETSIQARLDSYKDDEI